MTESLVQPVTATAPEIVALPEGHRDRLSLRTSQATFVAEAGQAALILFAVFVIYGSQRPLSATGLAGVAVAAGIWVLALRTTALPGRVLVGPAVAASVGSLVGFVVVTALNTSVVGLQLSFPALAGTTVAVFCSATVWGWCVDRTAAARRRVLLVGAEGVGDLLAEELKTCRQPRFDIVGAVAGSQELAEVVEAQHPDIVVLTDETSYGPALERLLDARANVRVSGFENFYEYAFGRVPVDRISSAWFMSLLHPRQHVYARLTKRTFDVIVALVGLVLTGPLMAALAIATKLSEGPILYRQTRVGEDGRLFTIYKFRTMACDAERDGVALARDDDPRATRVGCLLRRTHLDELPQLWNVVKGEMSIVGPRPERPDLINMIERAVPFWNRRLLVKPGITGWAQVRCGYASDCEAMETKLSYDLWYLRHRSLLVDLAVCVMTFFAIIRRPLSS